VFGEGIGNRIIVLIECLEAKTLICQICRKEIKEQAVCYGKADHALYYWEHEFYKLKRENEELKEEIRRLRIEMEELRIGTEGLRRSEY